MIGRLRAGALGAGPVADQQPIVGRQHALGIVVLHIVGGQPAVPDGDMADLALEEAFAAAAPRPDGPRPGTATAPVGSTVRAISAPLR